MPKIQITSEHTKGTHSPEKEGPLTAEVYLQTPSRGHLPNYWESRLDLGRSHSQRQKKIGEILTSSWGRKSKPETSGDSTQLVSAQHVCQLLKQCKAGG